MDHRIVLFNKELLNQDLQKFQTVIGYMLNSIKSFIESVLPYILVRLHNLKVTILLVGNNNPSRFHTVKRVEAHTQEKSLYECQRCKYRAIGARSSIATLYVVRPCAL